MTVEVVRNEIAPLTGLRGIAACWVVLYHTFATEMGPAHGALGNLLAHGYLAVDIFFVLSGFVMAMSYGQMFSSGFSAANFRVFLLRRLARIYPLYFVLTFFALAGLVFVSHRHFTNATLLKELAFNLILVNAWGLSNSIDGPSWSISTEAAAYLIFPALAAILLHGSRLVFLIGLLICLATIAALAYVQTPPGGERGGPLDIYWPSGFTVLRCVAEFSVGLVTFKAAQQSSVIRIFATPWLTWAVTILILALLMERNTDVLFVYMTAFFVIVLAVSDGIIAKLLKSSPAMLLGRLSYAIYLLHLPLLSLKHFLTPHLTKFVGPELGEALSFSIFCAVLLTMAYGCFRFIEVPGRTFVRGLETMISPRVYTAVHIT